ncbi:MAG: NAD-dependent epimerase/dehydratase family protein [Candidatus Dormibacteraeota bacterium]|nr:NAD-dependent epimerase/dehydratase family protein [Candidatus Dormibacteraeota bacterium]
MRIAVTGGTGFVGSHLVRGLLGEGHDVVVVSRGSRRSRNERLSVVSRDLTRDDNLAEAFAGCDAVIHLVAVIHERGQQTFERVNRGSAERVAAAAAEAKVPHVIHQSAIGASPDPRYPYLQTKWAAEEAFRGSGAPFSIIRPSLIFGPGDGFFTLVARLIRLNPVIPIPGSGAALFQPVSIDDVVRCHLTALERGPSLRVQEIGGPDHLTYVDIVQIVRRAIGARFRKLVRVPIRMLMPPAFVMNAVLKRPPITPQQLRLLEKNNITRIDAMQQEFGFDPLRFEDNADYLEDY